MKLSEIRRGYAQELIGAHIIARQGNIVVFAVGYPDREDDDGTPVWGDGALRRLLLSGEDGLREEEEIRRLKYR